MKLFNLEKKAQATWAHPQAPLSWLWKSPLQQPSLRQIAEAGEGWSFPVQPVGVIAQICLAPQVQSLPARLTSSHQRHKTWHSPGCLAVPQDPSSHLSSVAEASSGTLPMPSVAGASLCLSIPAPLLSGLWSLILWHLAQPAPASSCVLIFISEVVALIPDPCGPS